jgi:uncharacterized protein
MANQICYFELLASDMAASSAFYQQLFDWQVHAHGEGGCYSVVKPGGGIEGGLSLEMPEGNRVTIYIEVEDIEAKLKEIEAAGGKTIHPKTLINEDYGYFAYFADPAGTTMGLWSMK